MRTIKVIVVDDEALGRNRVKRLVEAHDQLQLIGEGKNGHEAIQLINAYKPDLVFLDVEMPDKDGFQVLKGMDEDTRPVVIFVTAHDRFALRAFDVHAVDFLHKPYDDERFGVAVTHAVQLIEQKEKSVLNDQLIQIVDDYRSKVAANPFMLSIKDRGRTVKVNLYDVLFIEADGNYLKLQLEKERFLVRNTMQQMIGDIDQTCFLRIHRSVIVNTNYLKVKSYRGNNEYLFLMKNGDEFVSGRSFKEDIDAFFELHS